MSFGGFFGGVIGGLVGSFFGPAGAAIGFGIGFGVGMMIDPIMPDVPTPGQPDLADLNYTTAKEGDPIADFLGTTKIHGNIFKVWGERVEEVTEEVETGGKGGGGGSETVVTGYKYYLSWLQAFSYGPDPTGALHTIMFGDDIVWGGNLPCPPTGGVVAVDLMSDFEQSDEELEGFIGGLLIGLYFMGTETVYVAGDPYSDVGWETHTITASYLIIDNHKLEVTSHSYNPTYDQTAIIAPGCVAYLIVGDPFTLQIEYDYTIIRTIHSNSRGTMYFFFGTQDQVGMTKVADSAGDDSTLNPGYPGLCYAFFDDVYIGETNYCPNVSIVVRKQPVLSFSALETIDLYDYNPSHAVWYIINKLSGLPTEFLNKTSFIDSAETLHAEAHGVSILFNRQITAVTYLESIMSHISGLIVYSTDEEDSSSGSSSIP